MRKLCQLGYVEPWPCHDSATYMLTGAGREALVLRVGEAASLWRHCQAMLDRSVEPEHKQYYTRGRDEWQREIDLLGGVP